jgi:hypothetical protein
VKSVRPNGAPLWLLPNLLSLDAPLVAVVWQSFLADCFGLPLRIPGRLVLALTVWAIYLADRLLDVRRPATGTEPARHQFYRNHCRLGVGMLTAVLMADLLLILFWLRPAVFRNGLFAFAAVSLYLFFVHLKTRATRIPKELLVALLFTAGTFLVAWTAAPNPAATLLLPALSFFLLCLANLVTIEMWEWRELRDEKSGRPHRTAIWLGRSCIIWVFALAIASFVFGKSSWWNGVALSAAAESLICAIGTRLSLQVRRMLVDAILLSPIFFFL